VLKINIKGKSSRGKEKAAPGGWILAEVLTIRGN
jgi:hypothetical protein